MDKGGKVSGPAMILLYHPCPGGFTSDRLINN